MQRVVSEAGPELAGTGINLLPQEGRFCDPESVSAFTSPRLDPLCYPGMRPPYSFVTADGEVYRAGATEVDGRPLFTVGTAEGTMELNAVLRLSGVATMDERVPIVGFGSNACPGQLTEKFSAEQNKWNDITVPGDHHIVPTLRGSMQDVAAAYSSKIGIRGYVFAELIEAPDATTGVFVNFLSQGQLRRMIRSESAYKLCDLGQVTIDGLSTAITAYGFAGKNAVMLDATGKPILLESTHTTGVDWPAMDQETLLTMLAKEFGAQLDARYAPGRSGFK